MALGVRLDTIGAEKLVIKKYEPNQPLQQTGAALRRSVAYCLASGPGC